MRLVLLAAFLSTFSLSLKAQKKGSLELSISGGLAVPLGKFSSTDQNDPKAGFANTGYGITINYSYFINSVASIEAMVLGNSNPINRKTLADQFSKTNFNILSSSITYYPNWQIEKANWRSAAVLAGLGSQWTMPDEGWRFKVKAMAGYIYVNSPEFKAESKTDTSYAFFNQKGSDGRGFAFGFGGTAVKDLSKRFAIGIDLFKLYTQQITFKQVSSSFGGTTGGLVVPGLYDISNSKGPSFIGAFTIDQKQDFDIFTLQLKLILKL